MPWDTTQLQGQFNTRYNADVIRFLSPNILLRIAISRTNRFTLQNILQTEDHIALIFTVTHTFFLHADNKNIYALALGMNGLVFRLPHTAKESALASGGIIFQQISVDWIMFNPFDPQEPLSITREYMAHWCKIAHDFASVYSA